MTFLSIGKVAKMLNVSRHWVRRNDEILGLTIIRLPKGHRRYLALEVEMIRAKMVSGQKFIKAG